jgi:hypothetical protein
MRQNVTDSMFLQPSSSRGCRPFFAEKEPLALSPGATNPLATAGETPASISEMLKNNQHLF